MSLLHSEPVRPHGLEALPREVRAALRQYRRRLRLTRGGMRLGLAAAGTALLLGAALILDRYFLLPAAARIALTAATAAAAATLSAWSLVALVRPLTPVALARRIETAAPQLGEALLSSVELALETDRERSRFSPHLVEALFRTTAARIATIDAARLISAGAARRALAAAVAAWVVLAAAGALHGESARMLLARFLHPARDLPRPSTVALDVSPGTAAVARGDDVEIFVRLARGRPVEAVFASRPAGSREWMETRRSFQDGAFSERFSALRRPLEYQARAGDFLSPVYRIEVREPPRPISFRITYRFPAYTGRLPDTVTRSRGDLAALRGTEADLEIESSEPLARARIELPASTRDLTVGAATAGDKRAKAAAIPIDESGRYRLHLETQEGIQSGPRLEYSIQSLPDRPPEVEIIEPREAEALVEERSVIEVRWSARDDVGVRSLELVLGKDGAVVLTRTLSPTSSSFRLDAAPLGLKPSEAVTLSLRARDDLGQEGRSAERTLRAALLPGPPEGPGWPAPLQPVEDALRAALEEWARLLPGPPADTPESMEPDPASAERLERSAERSLAAAELLRRAAGRAFEAGRGIAVPSPTRRALEGLGGVLVETAEVDCAAFWAEAAAVAGRLRGSAPVAAAALHAARSGVGARIEEALASMAAILRSERLEEALERCRALERDAAEVGSGPSPRRQAIEREAGLLAAELTKLAGAAGAGEGLETVARGLLEAAEPMDTRENGREDRAPGALLAAGARLEEHHERAEKAAAAAAERLSLPLDIEGALEALAQAQKPAEALSLARTVLLRLALELESVESREYADLETSIDLAALRDVVEAVIEEPPGPASGGPPGGGDRASRLREVLAASKAIAPSRAIGRTIQDLDHAASGEADLAFKLRGAAVWNPRTLRALARAQRETAKTVAFARRAIERLDGASANDSPLHAGLRQSLKRIDEALADMTAALKALASGPGEPPAGDAAIASAAETAGRASRELDETVEALEGVRASALPQAAAARSWLRAQLGTLAERVDRAAAAERNHAAEAKELSLAGGSREAPPRAQPLHEAHEATRGRVEDLAAKARKEGQRILASGGGVDALRVRDQAALALAAAVAGTMSEASAALRAGKSAGPSERPGLFLEASSRMAEAAARLEAIARALASVEAGEELIVSAKEVEGLLDGPQPKDDEVAADPARIAREARLFLDGCLRAAERIAGRAGRDARAAALVDALRRAADPFRRALDLAGAGDARGGAAALAEGRARLGEAVELARRLREAADGAVTQARKTLEDGGGGVDGVKPKQDVSRDLEAVYAELEKLLEVERLESEIAALFDEILGQKEADPQDLAELADKQARLERDLGESFVTAAELVELVSKLVAVDRRGREVASTERSLAVEAEKAAAAAGNRPGGLPELTARQAEAVDRARSVAAEFQSSGFKLSAVLPHVLKAYWKAGDAVEPMLAALEDAARNLTEGDSPPGRLLAAAGKVEAFLEKVEGMRRESLEAIADLERGERGANAAVEDLERARRSVAEAQQLLRDGKVEASSRAQGASRRSIADAAGSLRTRIEEVILPGGAEGTLSSRILDEAAARLGLGWRVLTRGSQTPGAEAILKGAGEMPFPSSFRDLVRVYLRAIEEGGKR